MSWPCKSVLSIEDVELRQERGGVLTLVWPSLGATDDVAVSAWTSGALSIVRVGAPVRFTRVCVV